MGISGGGTPEAMPEPGLPGGNWPVSIQFIDHQKVFSSLAGRTIRILSFTPPARFLNYRGDAQRVGERVWRGGYLVGDALGSEPHTPAGTRKDLNPERNGQKV